MTREQKLETIVKLFAKGMFHGDWKWETPNERVIEMLMKEVGYYPFKDEDEMIHHTSVDDNLYKQSHTVEKQICDTGSVCTGYQASGFSNMPNYVKSMVTDTAALNFGGI